MTSHRRPAVPSPVRSTLFSRKNRRHKQRSSKVAIQHVKICLSILLALSMSVTLIISFREHKTSRTRQRNVINPYEIRKRRRGGEAVGRNFRTQVLSGGGVGLQPDLNGNVEAKKSALGDEKILGGIRSRGAAASPWRNEGKGTAGQIRLKSLPPVDLDPRASTDAYGISQAFLDKVELPTAQQWFQDFVREAASLREEFASRYGGEGHARNMLVRGVTTFTPSNNVEHPPGGDIPNFSIRQTADRILNARYNKDGLFNVAFGGYSVTVGRGNYFHQSYPFVLRNLLIKTMQTLGINLKLRNAAIGGVPSFPYGWCLSNHLGDDLDVISWDYSMNEPNGVTGGLEAYVRNVIASSSSGGAAAVPMLVVKDTHMAGRRRDLLQSYVDNGGLSDPIVVHTDPATAPYLKLSEEERPLGFSDWRKFGGPPGAPGQAKHHPAVKEHELIGWLIAIHLLSALEVAAADMLRFESGQLTNSFANQGRKAAANKSHYLPVPSQYANGKILERSVASSLLFGYPVRSNTNGSVSDASVWTMNRIQCRTSFDPIIRGSLSDIVLSGTVGNGVDLMLPKGSMYYNSGWVLDYGQGEKKEKQKLERYGGLGYIDSKKAYYGVMNSGNLTLLLPYVMQQSEELSFGEDSISRDNSATKWFRSVVVCEVNEKRDDFGDKECNIREDMAFTVGGVKASGVTIVDAEGVSYLGKKLCVGFKVPEESRITRPGEGVALDEAKNVEVSLSLDISVTNPNVTVKLGACSVSHVVWEMSH